MKPLVNITMFRGYVNRVLPTVYDDSLSYYEVLAKVMEKLNEVIELDNEQNVIINNLPQDVSSFAEQLAQFESSMTDQFNEFKDLINGSLDAFEAEVNAKIATDNRPTQGSTKLVTSGGVYAAIQDVVNTLVKDAVPTQGSTNYITSGGVYAGIQAAVDTLNATIATKQNALTFDTTPTANSLNPVQSGGIKTYVDTAKDAVQGNLDDYITSNNTRSSTIEGDITALQTGKQNTLTFDQSPTLNSQNPVTSDGIARAISDVTPSITIDDVPTEGSTNAVSSNGVYQAIDTLTTDTEEALDGKQDELTFDVLPTRNSLNPVTSGGVWAAIAEIDPTGTIDPEPTEGSTAAVSSGGTWSALQQLDSTLSSAIGTKQDALTFDNSPTLNSANPVTSDGIYRALTQKQAVLTFDSAPVENSTNPVTSGGVWTAIQQGGGGGGTIDPTPTENSTNAVQSGGVWTALQGKQDTLTFDLTPTEDSANPVTSGGVWAAIQGGGGGGGDVSTSDLNEAEAYAILQGEANKPYNEATIVTYSTGDGYTDSISYTGGLTRFSNNYEGSDFWTWLNQEYIIGESVFNNDGKPDFIRVGDTISIDCGSHGIYMLKVIGINTYKDTYYNDLSESNGRTIDFMFARAWDVNRYYNNTAISHGGVYNSNVKYDYWTSSDLYAYCNSLANERVLGTATSPIMADTRNYGTDGVFYNLPSELKSVITPKYLTVAKRYTDNATLVSNDNGTTEINVGKIWLPTEVELKGTKIYGSSYSACGSKQYEFFRSNNFISSWLLTSPDGQHANQCYSDTNGVISLAANTAKAFRPCFSVAIENY